ncbi:hypothetical protein EDB84DRAFT_1435129 [Lactarius hengduanensis]|nr:hypothetical protein EDB84DRAFT_1435129 [Lactarius hengduanensis]
MPSNCQGIGDEAPVFRPSSARSGPTRPSRPRLGNENPSSPIEKHFVLQPSLCAVRQLSCFLATASHAPASFPPGAILNLNGKQGSDSQRPTLHLPIWANVNKSALALAISACVFPLHRVPNMPVAAPRQLGPPSQNAGDTIPKSTTYGTLFSMYITRVTKFEDEKDVENWKAGADSILVFTGLFSSTVATFIALSYPNLQQDPNITTQFLLAQISQQLSNTTTGSAGGTVGLSVQSSYVPPTSVVFINSVWFLSLVLSLTCALMATLLQQWARRYIQIVQRKYAPLHHARIHGFFAGGARRFGISKFVEVLPLLLLLSVFLFFAGLVVFAFRGNHTVAYSTLTVVGFCTLSYIAFTLMPLFFHDCPYHTPLTPVFRFSAQIISLSFLSVLYYGARQLSGHWNIVSLRMVQSLEYRRTYRVRSFSENIVSKLENSAALLSIDMYNRMLVRTLHWLSEDYELEEFVAGIPGLYESEAFMHIADVEYNVRTILANLPGLTGSRESFAWNIIELAQRASTSKLPKLVQQQRIRACLMALFYIPGAIRDVLASYAAGKHYCLAILPLLNTPESLEIIEELWDAPNDDVALSVRCAAAVVAAFMITPPHLTLDNFVAPDVGSIWDDNTGKQFLAKRLLFSTDADDDVPHPRSDSARLQNLRLFLTDIGDAVRYTNPHWWTSMNAGSVRRVRRKLFDTRRAEEYRTGHGTFDQQGGRGSPAFVPAAQQDLITLTLEILAWDPVAGATTSQRKAFLGTYEELEQVASAQARFQGLQEVRARGIAPRQARVRAEPDLLPLVVMQARVAGSFGVFKNALEPVLQVLQPPNSIDNGPAPAPPPPAKLPPPVFPLLYSASSSSAPVAALCVDIYTLGHTRILSQGLLLANNHESQDSTFLPTTLLTEFVVYAIREARDALPPGTAVLPLVSDRGRKGKSQRRSKRDRVASVKYVREDQSKSIYLPLTNDMAQMQLCVKAWVVAIASHSVQRGPESQYIYAAALLPTGWSEPP